MGNTFQSVCGSLVESGFVMKVLMTVFGPFGDFKRNPSEMVLEYALRHGAFDGCAVDWVVLPVAFGAVDDFIEGIQIGSYDAIIHTGVAAGGLRPQIEERACNRVKGRDVHGIALEGVIDKRGPALLTSPMSRHIWDSLCCCDRDIGIALSEDAGAYLCNYIFYKSLLRFGADTGVSFLHVADFMKHRDASGLHAQAELLVTILHCSLGIVQSDPLCIQSPDGKVQQGGKGYP